MPSQIFISYSHEDEPWKDLLVNHLRVLENEKKAVFWEDRQIVAGDDWQSEIEAALETAEVAVLLVTASFLTSGFIGREEVPRLLARRRSEGVRILPVIARPCAWDRVEWLAAIQCRPRDGRPLSTMTEAEADEAMASLAREIDDLLQAEEVERHLPSARPSKASHPAPQGRYLATATAAAITLTAGFLLQAHGNSSVDTLDTVPDGALDLEPVHATARYEPLHREDTPSILEGAVIVAVPEIDEVPPRPVQHQPSSGAGTPSMSPQAIGNKVSSHVPPARLPEPRCSYVSITDETRLILLGYTKSEFDDECTALGAGAHLSSRFDSELACKCDDP